jgi:hypothetical protein
MSNENLNNRSTAMTPELMASVNAAINDGVRNAFAEAISQLAPLLRDINKPYVDPAKQNRELREKMKFKQEEIEGEKAKRLTRDNCSHRDKNNRPSIGVVRNYPDRQPRGVCVQCQDWFYPREWRFDTPTEAEPYGTPHIVPAHPKYEIVKEAIRQQEG